MGADHRQRRHSRGIGGGACAAVDSAPIASRYCRGLSHVHRDWSLGWVMRIGEPRVKIMHHLARDVGRVVASASILILVGVHETAAQKPDIGFDQPCMAQFSAGYPHKFVPAEIAPEVRPKVRAVVARSLLWQPGEKIVACFRSGTQKARARVAQFASEWMKYANLTLDFGDPNNLRTCAGDNHEGIKVDFINTGPKSGYWSLIGTSSRKAEHSVNLSYLGEDELPKNRAGQSMPMTEARRLVLHEFGHAIGLFHEHQSPKSGCAAEYYEEAVFAFGALRGWSPDQTLVNFKQIADTPEFNSSSIDRKSIMHYSLPPWLFKAGDKSPCWVATNFELSETDKTFMAKTYPKPDVVASSPSTTVMRSVKTPASVRSKMVDDYRKALLEAGVAPGKAESLTKEFKASLGN